MTISITHAKVSGAGPSSDPALVGGDDWDDEHDYSGFGTAAERDAGAADGVAELDSGGKVPVAQLPGGTANGVATLDAGGKIPASQLPAIALVNTSVVASQAAMLALSAQTGDIAVRTDENKSYILAGTDPATLGDWQELLTPGSGVTTFNGRSGAVTPQTGDYVQANITGLTTADSPQFAGVNIGHASDTTVTRTAAGIIAVEGIDVILKTGAQDLAGKTIVGTKEAVFTISDGAAFEIDPANGGIQTVTLGANRTPAATNFAAGQSVLLGVADGSAYTLTWTTIAPVWVGGSAPTLATSGWTWIELWKVGSTIYAAHVGDTA